MGQFLKDLENGKEYEHKVLEIVQSLYPSETWASNTEPRWVDIVSNKGKTIEVKSDRMAMTTWNFFIEVECNGKPSWINAYSNMDVYAYVINTDVYLFNRQKLLKAIEDNNFRRVKGWDWWRVTWVLIPITVGEQLASKIIQLWT